MANLSPNYRALLASGSPHVLRRRGRGRTAKPGLIDNSALHGHDHGCASGCGSCDHNCCSCRDSGIGGGRRDRRYLAALRRAAGRRAISTSIGWSRGTGYGSAHGRRPREISICSERESEGGMCQSGARSGRNLDGEQWANVEGEPPRQPQILPARLRGTVAEDFVDRSWHHVSQSGASGRICGEAAQRKR